MAYRTSHKLGIAAVFLAVLLTTSAGRTAEISYDATSLGLAVALLPQNRATYQVVAGEQTRGTIDVYVHTTGTFLSLDLLLQRLGYRFYNDDFQIYQIDFADKTTLTIKFSKREYMLGGQTHTLRSDDFIIVGATVFVNLEFLNRAFPFGFSLDQSAQKLRAVDKVGATWIPTLLSPFSSEPTPDTSHPYRAPGPPDDDYPVPMAAPRIPVIVVDDLSARATPFAPKQKETLPEDVLRLTERSYCAVPPSSELAKPEPVKTEPTTTETAKTEPEKTEAAPIETTALPESAPTAETPPKGILEKAQEKVAETAEKAQEKIAEATEKAKEKIAEAADKVTAMITPVEPKLQPDKTCVVEPPPAPEKPPEEKKVAAAEKEAPKSEENSLILQPRLKKNPPNDEFIEAIEVDEKLYLPLAEVMRLLEFNIKVDPKKGTAEGTYIDSEHNFSLDVHGSEVTVNHKQYPLSKDSVFVKNDQIYVNSDDFAKWFDIQSRFDKKMMMLTLDTSVVLPVEARMQRHNLWDKLMAAQKAKQQNYEPVENPYQLISWPFVDVNLSSSYNTGASSGKSFTNNFTLLSAGDLGYLTTNIYAGGSSEDQLNNLRIVAGRKDPKGELLGPLHATAFSLGDIDSPALTLVTTNSLGRGVSVTNRAFNTPDNFDAHTFVGNAMPGWEVELYRNNVLLAFQIADNNGRYEFRDIPLVYGTNTFRIALYGPQGQSEDRIETYMVGSTMLKPDQFEYTFSVNQEGDSLIGLDANATNTSTTPRGLRGVAEARYGVAQFLTLGAGAAQAELNNGTHRYMTGSANTSLFGVLTEGNFVKDVAGGWATGLTAITSIFDVSVRARHRIFNNFTSEIENNPSDPRKSETTLDMNGQYYIPIIEDVNFGVRAKRETFTYQVPRLTYSSSYSKSLWGISFSNTLDLIRDTKQRMQGNLGVQTRLWNILFRFDGRYDVEPIMGPNGAMLTTQYRLTDSLSGQTQLIRELGDADGTSVRQTINWDLQDYRLSFSGEVDDKKRATVGVSLVFSVAHDDMYNRWHTQSQSMSGSGAIANKVFVDDNYNNIPEDNEKTFTDAILRMNRVPIRPRDDTTFIAPVGAYEPVNVDVDASTFKDPMLSSAIEGFRVTTRPGDVINLQFPVVSTSEIDGNVKLLDSEGKSHEIPDIVIELQDKNGKLIKRVMSESDGYFVLTRILPGEYILTIPPEALEEYKAELVGPVNVRVEKTSEFYTGNDITLRTNVPVEPKKRKGKK